MHNWFWYLAVNDVRVGIKVYHSHYDIARRARQKHEFYWGDNGWAMALQPMFF